MVNDRGSEGEEGNSWPPWFAPLALVIAIVASSVVELVIDLVAFGGHPTTSQLNNPPPAVTDIGSVIGEFIFVAAALWAASWVALPRAPQFGLRLPRIPAWKAALAVIGLYLTFLVLALLWTVVVNQSASEKYLVKDVGAHSGTLGVLASCLVFCVAAPICEEFLFRGFIFGALRSWRGPLVAAVVTGVLFGAVHAGSAPVVDLVPLGVLGMLLCGLRQFTGSLYPCIALHALNNSAALVSNAGWSFAAFVAVLLGSLGLIAALVALTQRNLRIRLV
jgi:membrane protease YdiL (CAAX protease family)